MNAQQMRDKLQGGEELGDIEACIGFAYKSAPRTAEQAAIKLAQLQEQISAVRVLITEWRYIAENKPMPTDKALGIEKCAAELEAALAEAVNEEKK